MQHTSSPSGEGSVVNRIPRDVEEDDDGDGGDDGSEAKNILVMEDRREDQIMPPSETVEKENTNESTKVVNSPTKTTTTLPLEKSNTEDNNNDEAKGKSNSTNVTTTIVKSIVFSPNWSEILESPVGLMGFSPSQTGSHHGLGKKTKTGRRDVCVINIPVCSFGVMVTACNDDLHR